VNRYSHGYETAGSTVMAGGMALRSVAKVIAEKVGLYNSRATSSVGYVLTSQLRGMKATFILYSSMITQ